MSTIICIQARMTSSRLPGKVMLPLAGAPLLERMIERVRAANILAEVVVITSADATDDPIEQRCSWLNVQCFRGNLTDLLDRHYQAARKYGASVVAKIPSDCPLVDPAIIRRVFDKFESGTFDYVSNLHPASFPDGNDVEVFTFNALEQAWREADRDFEREHTTPFLWERPERFRIGNVLCAPANDYSMTHRWTIDYPEDYEFIRTIYDYLWKPAQPIFSMTDIFKLLEAHPKVAEINARFRGVNWYRNHLGVLRTITPEQTRLLEPN
jgi:spore coat polysaccharide biosynthesis protein SpsF